MYKRQSSSLGISTNPNPRDLPVNLSVKTVAEVIVPLVAKKSLKVLSVVFHDNPPTKILVAMLIHLHLEAVT